ncbi:hypothetical protein [Xenorhabdus bovienii]|nr:hypothetical protein [Xenorhabdus bovienii]
MTFLFDKSDFINDEHTLLINQMHSYIVVQDIAGDIGIPIGTFK